MNVIEKARLLRELLKENAQKIEDKTLSIALKEYFETWTNGVYEVGDIRINPSNNNPYECIMAHDSIVNTSWDISVRTLWKPYHSTKKEYALPFEAPTGSHDMYKVGEYMIFNDGVYRCIIDTVYNPTEYANAWEEE